MPETLPGRPNVAHMAGAQTGSADQPGGLHPADALRSGSEESLRSGSEESLRSGSDKAFKRIFWLLLAAYVLAYLDRINVSFANLTMATDLGLSTVMFGVANSAFSLAYALFEIPSNLALARYGGRVWIPRIMITWGIASCLTMFAIGPNSFYALRFLVGAAEAGMIPGSILFLSYWFTGKQNARANGLLILGMPIALVIGAPMSGAILLMDGILGLQGWQWLFLIEGLPSVFLGIAAYYYLDDRPAKAKWLTPEERSEMERALAAERAAAAAASRDRSVRWRDLWTREFVLLVGIYVCCTANNNIIGTWAPLFVREFLGNTDKVFLIGLVTGIVPAAALITVPLWIASANRHNRRILHLAVALGVCAVGWVGITLVSGAVAKMALLTMVSAAGISSVAVYWGTAVPYLHPLARPPAIAAISTFGLIGSIAHPSIIGLLRDWTGDFNSSFWYVALLDIAGTFMLVALARATRERVARDAARDPA